MNIKNRMIMDEYAENKRGYEKLGKIVCDKIKGFVEEIGFVVTSFEYKLKDDKDIESLLYRNGDSYQSLADITDVLIVKVVCYFKDETEQISQLLAQYFNIDSDVSSDNVLVCSLSEDAGYDSDICGLNFEIQVKTVLENTWSTINNDLGYSEFGIPSGVAREFTRLAGLLEIADDEFVRVRDAMRYHAEISKIRIINDEADDVVIDAVSLNEYILHNKRIREFLEKLADIEGSEISDVNSESYISQLKWLRINTIGDLKRALDRHSDMAIELAKRVLKGSEMDILSSNVALRFLCRAMLINGGYDEEQMVEFFMLSVNKKERAEREAKRMFKMYANIREGQ